MTDLTPLAVRVAASERLISLAEFLQRADVNATTFWRWEKGEVTPRPLTLAKLRRAVEAKP
jgi:transcriptional regulator with XRE-family HTH domain